MSVKEHKREVLIAKRVRALALMLLTRREDLLIDEVTGDIGLDYMARFQTVGKTGLREFGIALRGVWAAVTKEHADKVLRPSLQKIMRFGPWSQPICVFFFTMEDDGAWYTWVAEPVEVDGKPLLRSCDRPDCQTLDKKALDEIIERVDRWYDKMFSTLVVNGAIGNRAKRKQKNPE